MKRRLLALLVVALLALAAPAAGQEECPGHAIDFDYDTVRAVLIYDLDAMACPAELGAIEVIGSLERRSRLDGAAEERAGAMTCPAGAACRLVVEMPHPSVEWADYRGEVTFRSTGPGPTFIVGGAWLRTTCKSAAVVAACTLLV